VLATLLVGLLATAASAAPRPISFQVFIGDSCVFGRAKNDSFLKVIIRDSAGNQKGREAVEADAQGYWQSCIFFGDAIRPGDKIDVEVFDTGQKRSLTVPLITGKVDRGTNVVSGKAPAGAQLDIEAFDFRWDLWGESYDEVRQVVATGGSYSYDFDNAGVDIKGGAHVVVAWHNGTDTVQVGRFQYAPFVSIQLGRSDFAGASGPNKPINIALKNGSTKVADGNGVGSYVDTTFFGEFAQSDGEAYRLVGGENLSAPALGASSSWRIPAINIATDVVTDKVTGKCFNNGRFIVLVESQTSPDFGFDFGQANANGNFTVDFTSQVNLRKGFRVAVLCYSPEGDEVVQESTAR